MKVYKCEQCGAQVAVNLPDQVYSAVHAKGEDSVMWNKIHRLSDENLCVGTLEYLGE